jgi:hypothetical protein
MRHNLAGCLGEERAGARVLSEVAFRRCRHPAVPARRRYPDRLFAEVRHGQPWSCSGGSARPIALPGRSSPHRLWGRLLSEGHGLSDARVLSDPLLRKRGCPSARDQPSAFPCRVPPCSGRIREDPTPAVSRISSSVERPCRPGSIWRRRRRYRRFRHTPSPSGRVFIAQRVEPAPDRPLPNVACSFPHLLIFQPKTSA